ncbi:MAG: M14 family zinc carboxypeptidase [Pseudomonadota bacterium]
MKLVFGLFVLALTSLSFAADAEEDGSRYSKIVKEMKSMEASHPGLAKVFSIGTNDEGTELYALRVSTSPQSVDPSKVGHFLVATLHGNEGGSTLLAMEFLKDLLQRYQSDELYKSNLAQTEFTVLPVLNVSGFNRNSRYEHGQDPNRDYEGPCQDKAPGKLKSIRTLMEYMGTRPFAATVTAHGYIGNFTYPWGFYTDNNKTLDENRYREVFRKVAEVNGYTYGNAGDIIYPANGTYEDYVYWKHGSWSLLLELRNGSAKDVAGTVPAIARYFDLIDSSPSSKNQFSANCTRHQGPDLRRE